jgi:uncharacterized protein
VFFLPKSDQFYEQLHTLAQCGSDALKLLVPRITERNSQPGIADVKLTAKKTVEQLTDGVCRTFVTPFDREDLQAFAFHLYRILKITDKINQRYGYRNLTPTLFEKQLAVINQQAQHMVTLVDQMRKGLNTDGVSRCVQLINDLEHQADVDYHDRLAYLYGQPVLEDCRDFVLQKDLLQHFDKVADTYRDAANLALQIVLKHS